MSNSTVKKVPRARQLLAMGLTTFVFSAVVLGCKGSSSSSSSGGFIAPVASPSETHVVLDTKQDLPGVVVTIMKIAGATGRVTSTTGGASVTSLTFGVGDRLSVTFMVQKNNGAVLPLAECNSAHFVVSGPTSNYQRIFPSAKTDFTVADVKSASIINPDGSYTYTFPPFPAKYTAPLNDTAKFADGELTGQALLSGTYTLGLAVTKDYYVKGKRFADVGNATADFLFGGAGRLEPREVVKVENCNKCHVRRDKHEFFRDTKLCVLCHTSGAEDNGSTDANDPTPGTTDFRVMIHKIHNGGHLPSVLGIGTKADGTRDYDATPVPYKIGDGDFSEVTFPAFPNMQIQAPRPNGYSKLTSAQKTKDNARRTGAATCAMCHGAADADTPAPAQGDVAYTQPSRRACGACHDDINWAKAFVVNTAAGMPPQADDASCNTCHAVTGGSLAVKDAHLHPLKNPAIFPGNNFSVRVAGGNSLPQAGAFQFGDTPEVEFTIKDDAGNDIPPWLLDSWVASFFGPTYNRQPVLPLASANGFTFPIFDGTGRLQAASATGKGQMSRISGTVTTDVYKVLFTSATAFNVTGATSGALGGGALPFATNVTLTGHSMGSIALTTSAVAQTIQVVFSDAQNFTVSGSVSGAMGVGQLQSTTSCTTRFVSTDGTVGFDVAVTTNPYVNGSTFNAAVFRGPPGNSLVFMIVAGTTAFAVNDHFYYQALAPSVDGKYRFHLPVDYVNEFLGVLAAAAPAGTTFTPANAPSYYGRQLVATAVPTVGSPTFNLITASPQYARYVNLNGDPLDSSVNAAWAAGDTVVIDAGTPWQEYAATTRFDVPAKQAFFATALRFAHAAGAPVTKVTLTNWREGVNYSLGANGAITTLAVNGGVPLALVISYRADARFGWRRVNRDNPGFALVQGVPATWVAAVGAATASTVDIGTHSYRLTFVDQVGNEGPPIWWSNQVNPLAVSIVGLTGIPLGPPGTTARKLYRSKVGDVGPWFLLATISNNTETQYTDKTADAKLGAAAPNGLDALQNGYSPSANDAASDETWGDWTMKPFADGTYTIAVYGYYNRYVYRFNENQAYRGVARPGLADFIYATPATLAATTLEPYSIVEGFGARCNDCHVDLAFHGGGRRGPEVCMWCHGQAGFQRAFSGGAGQPSTGGHIAALTSNSVNFRQMIHSIHAGSELSFPSLTGAGDVSEIEFPAVPGGESPALTAAEAGGVKNCTKCHGDTNTAWHAPRYRGHPNQAFQGAPFKGYQIVCLACHDSVSAKGHAGVYTDATGKEACGTCHDVGAELGPPTAHKVR